MNEKHEPLPPDEFARVVRGTQLVSVDVLLFDNDGRVLLGRRTREPAKNTWFTPGGRVYKNECLNAAVKRVISAELVAPPSATARPRYTLHGVYRHLYDTNFSPTPYAFGTDYINFAYVLHTSEHYNAADGTLQRIEGLTQRLGQNDPHGEQHTTFRWFAVEDLLIDPEVHHYVKCYFHPAAHNRVA